MTRRKTSRLRGAIALLLALAAAGLAAMPWLGAWSHRADALASFLPLAVLLAVAALIVAGRRSGIAAPILAIAALLSVLPVVVPELRWSPDPVPPMASRPLTIVTHNVAMGNVDPEGTFEALRRADADIVMLQEAGGTFRPQVERLKAIYPFSSFCRPGCDTVLLSRLPLVDRPRWRFRGADGKSFGPPLIWAQLLLPNGEEATLVTWHAPWPVPGYDQAIKRLSLIASLKRVDTSHLILAGDFNLTPWAHGMRQLDRGLAPARRVSRGLFSFPARVSWKPWPLPLLPIDHMFVGPAWSVLSVERLPRTGSDHYPVKVVLARRN